MSASFHGIVGKSCRSAAAFVALVAVLAAAAPASGIGTIIQPVSASTNMGWVANYEPFRAIDQSGLAANYVSGVTDFTGFAPSTATVNGGAPLNSWYSQPGVFTGNFDFALGGSYSIDSFSLWNDPLTMGQGINQFRLYGDDNAAFSSPALMATFNAPAGTPDPMNFGLWFLFSPYTVSHVRMEIVSNHGSTLNVGFVEAAFGTGIIPAPSGLALLLPGALWMHRRRR
jgi:hypothetical protein